MNPDPNAELARLHRADLLAAAQQHRLARASARPGRPARAPLVLRLYARIWWASRPRAAAWTPSLFST